LVTSQAIKVKEDNHVKFGFFNPSSKLHQIYEIKSILYKNN